jgi:ankyrin repeat protein
MIFDLIEGFPQAASNRDGYGFLPIHHACNSGVRSSEIVRSLIKMSPESVKSEATTSRNSRGPLPLHFALAHQSEAGDRVMDNVIELLLHEYPQGSKIKDPDSDVLPIHAAFLSKRSASVLKTLMTLSPHELSTMSEIQEDGQKKTTSTLHLFSAQCHSYMSVEEIMEVIQLFQRIKPSLFKQKDSDGRLPLHLVWKQTETIEESRQALVAALLDEHPDAVYAKDNADNTPLSYIARAKDVHSFDKIFPMNPFAAAIMSKEEGMYPLHKLCGFGAYGNFSEAFDKMLTALIQQHPEAAGVSDENGNLPLHSLCKTAGSFHAEKHTIQKLVQAYPYALNATDASGMFPLQLVVAAATDSDDTQEHRHWLNFSDLLIELNPAVASTVENGLLPLRTVLDRMETLSIHRRNNDDHVLQLVTRLYDTFPGAIRWHASRKQNGLHSLVILVGDLGGATPKGWSDFVVRVIQDFPELSKEKDTHERTPLHVLSLYLGDTGLSLRENQDPRTTVWTAALDEVFLELLRANVDAMDTKDEYGLLPIDIIQHDRLRYAKGGRRYYQSAIVNQMKAYLRRGHGYWRMKVAIQDAKSCGALRSTLTRLRHELQNHLVEFDIQSITEPFACDGEEMSICQRCIDEQELLGEVDLLLSTYAKVMEERGRDASEISGEYTSY